MFPLDPYIGVTGFVNKSEVEAVLSEFSDKSPRKLMVGVLASLKTLNGEISQRFPNRYPRIETISDIFPKDPRVINLIHYNTRERDTLAYQLLRLVEIGGPNLHGFQLNMAWPPPEQLAAFHAATGGRYRLVFQINEKIINDIESSPKKLLVKFYTERYDEFVDSILIDPSGGQGKSFDTTAARDFLEELESPLIGMGVAGGLCADTLSNIVPLLKDFPNLSTDAEGKLRNQPDDTLNLGEAVRYVRKNLEMAER